MGAEYTPTTEGIRAVWVALSYSGEAFDRWLVNHDRDVAAKALEDAADVYRSGQLTGMFMGRDDYAKAWLSARAAALRVGANPKENEQ